ncbi:MAG TPA: HEAT repeat domain-containing protein [Planctomycetes bacterium]|nr:HEAT repeat domain-containing protein [Planctomycetota bacterium]
MVHLGFVLIFMTGITSVLSGQAPQVFLLRSGDAFEGIVQKKASEVLHVQTPLGRRDVPVVNVLARRPVEGLAATYESKRNGLAKADRDGHLSLARWCKTRGYLTGMVAELKGLLSRDPQDTGALALVESLAPHYRLARPNPMPKEKPRWARREKDLLFSAAAKADIVRAALLRSQLGALPSDILLGDAVRMARKGTAPQRWIATYLLGMSESTRRVKPLYRCALGDPSTPVRRQAVASLVAHDDGTTLGPFVKALLKSDNGAIRVHAAEALETLGDRRAIPALALALRATQGGGVVRDNVVFTRQRAYVKDYDVEIAQGAAIADPVIDIVTEGVVLDVGVVSIVTQRRAFRRSLRALSHKDFGYDARAWARWYETSGR